jgi:hypothetical protein
MNLRLKAISIVSILFASLYLITEVCREYITRAMVIWGLDILELGLIAGLIYACYRSVLFVLEMREENNRPKDTFPDENA